MAIDRAELRDWLEANCPAEMREPGGEDDTCWGGRRWVFQSGSAEAVARTLRRARIHRADMAEGIRRGRLFP